MTGSFLASVAPEEHFSTAPVAQPLLNFDGAKPMSPKCPVLRRCLSFLRRASSGTRIWMIAAVVSLTICAANAQFPLNGLYPLNIPQQSPPLELSGISDTVTLSWPAAASNFVLESSSDLASGTWTRANNEVIEVVGNQTIATVPLTSDQQFYRLHGPKVYVIPIFQFAVFYDKLMEFTWAATFVANGRVHGNGDIYVGSSSALTFNSLVSAAGGIYKTNWDGHTTNQMTGPINYNGNPASMTNVSRMTLPVATNGTPAGTREVINMPPSGEDPLSDIALQRYYNRFGVTLLVSNMTVTAYLKNSLTSAPTSLSVTNWGTNSVSLLATFPFLSLTNSFIDQRELSKTVRPTQIDVGLYSQWLANNADVQATFPGPNVFPNVLYVADNRTIATNTDLFAVRLLNGSILPTNGPSGVPGGWTVATPNPLYVWGHYNIGPGGSTTPGNIDTSKTFPASLVSDALTILSPNWQDAQSSLAITDGSKSKAVNNTVNAAILTGIVYSTDGTSNHFSGGVLNVTRLLEDWTGVTLTLNTSIVNLFDSARATNWFRNPGVYYYAPTRLFSFDRNFTNWTKLPPATPLLRVVVAPQ